MTAGSCSQPVCCALCFQKNLLISLYDEDDFKYDNLMHALSFDISSLTPGTKETKEFFIDPQVDL